MMYFCGLKLEYALEGSSNYIAWKDNMEAVLEENRLTKFLDSDISQLTATYAQLLDAWKKNVQRQDGSCYRNFEIIFSRFSMGR